MWDDRIQLSFMQFSVNPGVTLSEAWTLQIELEPALRSQPSGELDRWRHHRTAKSTNTRVKNDWRLRMVCVVCREGNGALESVIDLQSEKGPGGPSTPTMTQKHLAPLFDSPTSSTARENPNRRDDFCPLPTQHCQRSSAFLGTIFTIVHVPPRYSTRHPRWYVKFVS